MTRTDEILFELPERHVRLREEAAALAASVAHLAAEADEADAIDPGMRAALAASGLAAVCVPAAYGGRYEHVDSLAVAVVREQLAAESAHLDSLFAMQGIGSYALTRGGTPEVRERWLPRVAALDAIAALGLTEPGIGSDLRGTATTITEDGGELVIDGHKSFITNGGDADFYCVLGKEDAGLSMVLVPADAPGLTTGRPHQIIAPHVLGDVVLDGVRVPRSHRLGEPGAGMRLGLATLATFRVSVAAAAVGTAQAALREAVAHTTGREQFGRPLIQLGAVAGQLARSWTEIEAARAFTYRAAAAASRDPLGSLHLSSMAKVAATETAGRVVDRCVQVMGRFGLVRGSKIERLYRAARPMRIYEGATEVILDSLARKLAKELSV
jgi:acyl-CoA dehydrogenase